MAWVTLIGAMVITSISWCALPSIMEHIWNIYDIYPLINNGILVDEWVYIISTNLSTYL